MRQVFFLCNKYLWVSNKEAEAQRKGEGGGEERDKMIGDTFKKCSPIFSDNDINYLNGNFLRNQLKFNVFIVTSLSS